MAYTAAVPWHIVETSAQCPASKPWGVANDADGDVGGRCHETRERAIEQMRALYANEPDAAATQRSSVSPGCSCGGGTLGADVAAGIEQAIDVVTAALATEPFSTAFPVPEYPPAGWFARPTWVPEWRTAHGLTADGIEIDPETGQPVYKMTVTDDGQVGGWFYDKGHCIVHNHQACPKPSPTQYAAFHQNDVVVEGGAMLRVGVIGNTHGHASPWVDYVQAQRHYADPDAQMIICRAGDDERGGWIAGAIIPGLTYGDVAMLRRSALSGDWRPMPATWWKANRTPAQAVVATDGYDCIGPTLVTRPALPLVEAFAASVGARPSAILGGNGGVQLEGDQAEPPSHVVTDDDGTVHYHTEVEGMPRRTTLHPDGVVEIVDETPADAQAAVIAASLIGDLDLPLAPVDRTFDEDGAASRILRAAASEVDATLDLSRAYLYRWTDGDETMHGFPIADLDDGNLVIVPAAVRAAALRVDELSPALRDAMRARLDVLFARFDTEFGDDAPKAPWVAAPEDGLDDTPPDDAAETGPPTREEFDALDARLSAVEEFCAALIESQMAAAGAPAVAAVIARLGERAPDWMIQAHVAGMLAADVALPSPVAEQAALAAAGDVPIPAE